MRCSGNAMKSTCCIIALHTGVLLAALPAKAGQLETGGMLVGQAPTTEHRRPHEGAVFGCANEVRVRLARNEHEGVQILVAPNGRALNGVHVEVVSPVKRRAWYQCFGKAVSIASDDIKVYTVGYVQTKKSPRHYRIYDKERSGEAIPCPVGWWPDPLLDFVRSVDVDEGTVQGFWVDVFASESLPAGFYDGMIVVSASNAGTVNVPFVVRVNDFTLPKVPVMPTAVSIHPPVCQGHDAESEARREDPNDICNIWKRHEDEWTDFAADHLITVSYLYPQVRPRFDQLMRLKAQGRLGMFNLGYWRHSDEEGVTGSERWKSKWFSSLDADYAKAKELGILDHAYLYGEDEIPKRDFAKVAVAAKCIKERYPYVPLLTTCMDEDYGVAASPLGDIDWFTPLTANYDLEKAETSRASGHKVFWYISNLPLTGWANMFVEKEPIESRLLMGAMATKMKVDGFLFYATCAWAKNTRPIESGPYTSWDPVSFEDYHGCGSWMYCGPDGRPVTTVRLENYRDGLEDLAYVKLLKDKGVELPVPEDVVTDMTHFTQKSAPLMAWRDKMADLIEGDSK